MSVRRFTQVDVFSERPTRGNALAVVVDGDGLDDEAMAAFARWTNLSETTFLLPSTDPAADYRVRIWTVGGELPFAGHPTLGSCRAWLEAGGTPREPGVVVQECGVGLVRVRIEPDRLAFAAPPLLRSGPLTPDERARTVAAVGLSEDDVLDAAWIDNGPGWQGLLVRDADTVLRARLVGGDERVKVGLVGVHPEGGPADVEVRAFYADETGVMEDPVTGSANAGLALWLLGEGVLPESYVARQGTAVHRDGRVYVDRRGEDVWVGGAAVPLIGGTVDL